ncbi:MAG: hypothetical protein KIT74_12270 [Fimbriimonadales bacterium]|nr:hypothetical protein [Fimbriimonadales bacterium]
MTRKEFLSRAIVAAAATTLPPGLMSRQTPQVEDALTLDDIKAAAKVAGVEFSESELQQILRQIQTASEQAKQSRANKLDNSVAPPTPFFPSSDRSQQKRNVLEFETGLPHRSL